VRVHLAREHALEFELLHLGIDVAEVGLDRARGALVVLAFREIEQLAGFGQPLAQLVERGDDGVELGALAAELLRALGLLPDGRVLELAQDLGQALALALVVKGTPSARSCAR
jgi:hypothetical protein